MCSIMKGDIIIRNTDTDLLAIALINHTQLRLGGRNIVIRFGKSGQEFVYWWINQFVKLISSSSTYSLLITRNIDVSTIIGVMHFITGCNVLSCLYSFTIPSRHSTSSLMSSALNQRMMLKKQSER